jgi:hypothetical protein
MFAPQSDPVWIPFFAIFLLTMLCGCFVASDCGDDWFMRNMGIVIILLSIIGGILAYLVGHP